MAQLAISRIGAQVGKTLLPKGIRAFGLSVSGAQIGRAVGSYIGSALTPARDGPRIETLPIMESREGAGMPSVYGRMRVAGHLIWASRFKERSRDRRTAGKGSPRYREYRYSVSFAVALCEGEISRIGQVWANGEPLDLSGLNWRLYTGSETQSPDPLIEAIEGADNALAYRGAAYIVFEDLPLENFGNRIPQLSFEVFRRPPGESGAPQLRDLIQGVNIIPASGEFAYDTETIRTRRFPGIETPQNANSSRGEADFSVSMDQLQSDLPSVRRAALTVGWFGNDLRAGNCSIRPGVELSEKSTVPENWRAGGVGRAQAHLISRDAEGHASYGGTPSDASIIRALRDLASRGIEPVVTPFLFMDVPSENGLPDPYGGAEQAPFPWRGRITGTAPDISAFMGNAQLSDFQITGEQVVYSGDPSDWGYRRFILHLAHVAKISGSVEAFLIGSEMVSLTRVQASDGSFPFVDGLAALADDVKALLGSAVKVSYAADWTEYGAYVSGPNVYFPLDKLWARASVDFIGIDWYPPMADWRDGENHIDAEAYEGLEDLNYLAANIEGGEGYDWYYADEADRLSQIRTPIVDTAHGEHWVFRQKDLVNWWASAHHARPSGVRNSISTDWVPGSKPVRLMEIGFPAIDKGANAPNLFFDPKSSESSMPPFSDGTRNDLQQRRALEAALGFWQSQAMIEAAYVWCWDARPFPAFPARSDVWSDGGNWQFGHWLNGRVGAAELGNAIKDICARGGVTVDMSELRGVLEGFALTGVYNVRGALEPLRSAYGFDLIERGGELVFLSGEGAGSAHIDASDMLEDAQLFTRRLLDKRPGALRLTYISETGDYAPATVEARSPNGDMGVVVDVSLPLVMSAAYASAVAKALLAQSVTPDTAKISLPLAHMGVEPGDVVALGDNDTAWRVTERSDAGIASRLTLLEFVPPPQKAFGVEPAMDAPLAWSGGVPELVVVDALGDTPLVAAAGTPWPGRVSVMAGTDPTTMAARAELSLNAEMGRVLSAAQAAPLGRWDRATVLEIHMPKASLSSAIPNAVLSGANRLLVQTEEGWELLAFTDAELIAEDTYRLTGFLRGLQGTAAGIIPAGAVCLVLDEAVQSARVSQAEIGAELIWRAETDLGAGETQTQLFEARGSLEYAPGHLRAHWDGGELQVRWTRRGADAPESWTLPEADNSGRFRLEAWDEHSLVETWEVNEAAARITPPIASTQLKISTYGPDGRAGAAGVLLIPGPLA